MSSVDPKRFALAALILATSTVPVWAASGGSGTNGGGSGGNTGLPGASGKGHGGGAGVEGTFTSPTGQNGGDGAAVGGGGGGGGNGFVRNGSYSFNGTATGGNGGKGGDGNGSGGMGGGGGGGNGIYAAEAASFIFVNGQVTGGAGGARGQNGTYFPGDGIRGGGGGGDGIYFDTAGSTLVVYNSGTVIRGGAGGVSGDIANLTGFPNGADGSGVEGTGLTIYSYDGATIAGGNNGAGNALQFNGGDNYLKNDGRGVFIGGFNINGGTLTLEQSVLKGQIYSSATYNNVISGSGALRIDTDSGNSVRLNGVNTIGGGVTVTAGSVLYVGDATHAAAITGSNGVSGGDGTAGATAVSLAAGGYLGNNGTLTGGNGGNARKNFGLAGAGGDGASFTGDGGRFDNTGTIRGGKGGLSTFGTPGNGGSGVVFNGSNSTFTNSGTIRAGDAGGSGFGGSSVGGDGVKFVGSGVFTNSGTVAGGSGPGNGNAVTFSGGTGTLNNLSGGALNGPVSFTGGQANFLNGFNAAVNSDVNMDSAFVNNATLQIKSSISGKLNLGTNSQSTLTLSDNGNGGTQSFSQAVVGTLTFNGSLLKSGPGTWTIDRSLNYGGATAVIDGTLQIGDGTADHDGSLSGTSGIAVYSPGTLAFNLSGDQSINYPVFAGGMLVKNGPAALTLGGTSDNISLPATVNAGTLILGKTSSGGVHAIGNGLTINALATAQLGGTGGDQIYDNAGVQINGGTFDLNGRSERIGSLNSDFGIVTNTNSSTVSSLTVTRGGQFNGYIPGSSYGIDLVVDGAGQTFTLGGGFNNPALGATVNAGTLVLGKASYGSVHALGSTLTVNSGATARLGGYGGDQIFDGAGVVLNGGTFDLNGQTETIGVLMGGSGTITNTYSSGGSALTVTGGGEFGGVAGSSGRPISIIASGAGKTLTLNGTANNTNLAATANAGTLVLAKASSSSVHAIGSGGLTVNSGAIVLLAGSGGDQIDDTATLQLTGGGFELNGRNETIANLNGTGGVVTNTSDNVGTLTVVGGGTFSGQVGTDAYGMSLVMNGNTLTLDGTGNNNQLVAYANAGTLVLAKDSPTAHSAQSVVVNGGTVKLAGSGGDQIAENGGMSMFSGTFDLNGRSETLRKLFGSGGTITNSASGTTGTLTLNGGSFSGAIVDGQGAIALVKATSDVLTLRGGNGITGGVSVNGGTLILDRDGAITTRAIDGSAITVAAGATLEFASNNTLGFQTSSGSDVIVNGGTVNTPGENYNQIQNLTLNGAILKASGGFANFGSYAVRNTLTSTGISSIDIPSANHGLLALSPAGTTTFNVTDNTLTVNALIADNALYGGGGIAGTLRKTGRGTLVLAASNTYTGGTIVAAGTLRAAKPAHATLLSGNGTDVQGGRVVFDYATPADNPTTTIRSLLADSKADNGFHNTKTLRSTTADAKHGLGYADNGSSVTVMATLYGDSDLDGSVSINDFNALAGNFGQASGKVWVDGDFDYDGGVSINDFNLLAAGFGQSAPASFDVWAGLLAFAAAHDDLSAFEAVTGVPEPTTLATLVVAASLGLRRQRRDMQNLQSMTPIAS